MIVEIKFNWFQINELTISTNNLDTQALGEINYSFDYTPGFPEDGLKVFGIKYLVEMNSLDNRFRLKLEAVAHFEVNNKIDEAFKESHFTLANAPAIGFPFVRTFISNITLNMGYTPIILPSFNFNKLAKDKLEKLAQVKNPNIGEASLSWKKLPTKKKAPSKKSKAKS